MTNEFITQLNDSSKASYETFQQFNVINVETLQKLAALQFSLASLSVESTVEQAKLLSNGSDLQELFAAESALASSYGEKLMQISSETTEIFTRSGEQIAAFAGKRFETVSAVNNTQAKQTQATPAKKASTKKAPRKAA